VAFSVTRLLEEHFDGGCSTTTSPPGWRDVLDEVAGGREDTQRVLGRFWFGGDDTATGLKQLVSELGEIDAREMATFAVRDPDGADTGIVLRVGRYGPYVEDADGNRGNVPDDLPPDELTADKARELLATPAGAERELGTDPATGRMIVARNGRYGAYVTEVLGDDEPKSAKARTGSLFRDMHLDTITLEDALRLLSLPRVVGSRSPSRGSRSPAQNGRYGPLPARRAPTRGRWTPRSSCSPSTLEEALAIYAQPKQRGRAAAKPPLRELGDDPKSGKAVTVKEGRLRCLRHRRGDQRDPAASATTRQRDHRARRRAPRREAGRRARTRRSARPTKKKAPAKRAAARKPTAASAAKKG
jgi:DNA topoisomerase-1